MPGLSSVNEATDAETLRPMSHAAVLYVEDDPNDIMLMRYAWTRSGMEHPLQIVPDGDAALRYLSGEGAYADRMDHPIPSLVLMDLKLPKVSGLDVLKWIRAQPTLQELRVIVLSSSKRPPDIGAAHSLRIDAYLVKSHTFDEWVDMVRHLRDSWLTQR